MRSLSPALHDKWRAGVTTLARGWRLQRRDGLIVAATEHDRDIEFDGTLFKSALSLNESPVETELSLSPGHAALSGALSLAGVAEDDIRKGLWDQARVEAFALDWQDPHQGLSLWSGFVQEIIRHGARFELTIQTLEPALNHVIGRHYTRTCDAVLGDARCGVAMQEGAFTARGTIVSVPSDRTLFLGTASSLEMGAFTNGILKITSGRAIGLARTIYQVEPDVDAWSLQLAQPLSIFPEAGDEVMLSFGCDKHYDTCRNRFGNGLNFRGQPTLPGEAAAVSGPSLSGNTGGRR